MITDITFECPITLDRVTIKTRYKLYIGGSCADDIYPSNHKVFISCPSCENEHELTK